MPGPLSMYCSRVTTARGDDGGTGSVMAANAHCNHSGISASRLLHAACAAERKQDPSGFTGIGETGRRRTNVIEASRAAQQAAAKPNRIPAVASEQWAGGSERRMVGGERVGQQAGQWQHWPYMQCWGHASHAVPQPNTTVLLDLCTSQLTHRCMGWLTTLTSTPPAVRLSTACFRSRCT